jgi:hypothetical protein
MIGLVFNTDNKAQLIHYQPEKVDSDRFDKLVEQLPEKDQTKSDMRAELYQDTDGSLFWQYSVIEEEV